MFLNTETLLPIGVFLAITLAVWSVLMIVAGRPMTAEDRLKRVLDPGTRRPDAASLARQQDKIQARVADAAKRLGQSMRPTNEAEVGKIRLELLNAGFRGENAVAVYYGFKLFAGMLALAIATPIVVGKYGMTQQALPYIVCAGGLAFYLPGIVIGQIKKRRMEAIFLGLPDAIDLMVVCVEAGLGLDTAMRRVTTELATACPALCDEFGIANFQVQMGRVRRDVLRDLGVRTGVDDMRALAAVIIQAEKFGSSIGQALRVHSDSMRTKRRQLAEERAAKTAVKIMIPLVLFIFPGVFVVLVGPAGIQIAKTMMGAG
ncbi:MAG: type II secretion system F family protein [Thermoleophilia bacterium]|nr:type II secretion system F family protein [Thermoleophilia bacterium]